MSNFTELAYLGNLSQFNLDQLKKKLHRWNFELTNMTSEFMDVKFTEKVVNIEIRYTIKGDFVTILCEEWKGIEKFDFRVN